MTAETGHVWRRIAFRDILDFVKEGGSASGVLKRFRTGGVAMASIVLADDDEDLRAVYVPFLRSSGHTVWEASGGVEALELVREHRPGLLILDVWMPEFNGFEVLEALRHDSAAAGLKVMMLSNLGDADTRLECFEMGAAEYLVKGLSLIDLRAKIGILLADSPSSQFVGGREIEPVP